MARCMVAQCLVAQYTAAGWHMAVASDVAVDRYVTMADGTDSSATGLDTWSVYPNCRQSY